MPLEDPISAEALQKTAVGEGTVDTRVTRTTVGVRPDRTRLPGAPSNSRPGEGTPTRNTEKDGRRVGRRGDRAEQDGQLPRQPEQEAPRQAPRSGPRRRHRGWRARPRAASTAGTPPCSGEQRPPRGPRSARRSRARARLGGLEADAEALLAEGDADEEVEEQAGEPARLADPHPRMASRTTPQPDSTNWSSWWTSRLTVTSIRGGEVPPIQRGPGSDQVRRSRTSPRRARPPCGSGARTAADEARPPVVGPRT